MSGDLSQNCARYEPEPPELVSRRSLLAAVGGGILVSIIAPKASAQEGSPSAGAEPAQAVPAFNAHLRIGANGRVTCFVGKIEMGQGPYTSLAMTLAEELDIPLFSVDMVMGDTALCPYDAGTWGSLTTRSYAPQLRNAAAQAKAALKQLGAEKLGVSVSEVSTADGAVFVKADPSKRVTYAELTQGQAIMRTVSGASPDPQSEYTIVGKPTPRLDAVAKVTGRAQFAGDIRLPGMLYARILRPPSLRATLKSVDLSEAEKLPGVIAVNQDGIVAVLHEQPDMADRAIALVKATWQEVAPVADDKTIHDYLVRTLGSGSVVASGGSLTTGTQQSEIVFEHTYLGGYLAHATIETHTAVAEFKDGQMTVWASTQSPFGLRNEIAQALRLSASKVRIITPFVGGGFGGKSENSQGVEAARLARIVGRPVQVARTREEEFLLDHFRPAAVVKIRSGATKAGKIVLWDYTVYGVGDRGAPQFYDVPNHRTRSAPDQGRPLSTGPWRAPGNNANTFARESQIDIMAVKLGIDPVQFRLDNLTKNQRMRRTLETAAKQFGWEPKPAPSGRGVGVALGIDAGTHVATIAQVEVDKSTGRIKVPRVVCAQDMGFVVNPEGAIAQIESCVNMGIGYTLFEELHFNGTNVLDRSFASYRIPRFSDVPQKIEAVLVDAKDSPSQGGGEPAIITVGAAVANAVFDATGARLFQLPMTPERVLAALEKAEPPAAVKGDINGDGKLSTADAILAVQMALGLRQPSDAQLRAGDVNANGALDLGDATRILRAAVGKEPL